MGSFNHIGIVHNAGKVGLYYNGVRQHEATITLSGNQTSISYGSLANLYINNLRLIQKNVAEGQSFPYDVPATYYTGFEPV